jgi:hypothetical protein
MVGLRSTEPFQPNLDPRPNLNLDLKFVLLDLKLAFDWELDLGTQKFPRNQNAVTERLRRMI